MNSWLSLIKSSVKPLSAKSCPKCSRHRGSNASRRANSEGGFPPLRLMEDMEAWLDGTLPRGESGGVGAEE
jgi:hypothetical protein